MPSAPRRCTSCSPPACSGARVIRAMSVSKPPMRCSRACRLGRRCIHGDGLRGVPRPERGLPDEPPAGGNGRVGACRAPAAARPGPGAAARCRRSPGLAQSPPRHRATAALGAVQPLADRVLPARECQSQSPVDLQVDASEAELVSVPVFIRFSSSRYHRMGPVAAIRPRSSMLTA